MSYDAYLKLERIFETYYFLKRNLSVLNWDSAVIMNEAYASIRDKQVAAQNVAITRTLKEHDLEKLISKAENSLNSMNGKLQT